MTDKELYEKIDNYMKSRLDHISNDIIDVIDELPYTSKIKFTKDLKEKISNIEKDFKKYEEERYYNCPYCGSKLLKIYLKLYTDPLSGYQYIKCPMCGKEDI